MICTAVLSPCGQLSGRTTAVVAQSLLRISAPSSPPPLRKRGDAAAFAVRVVMVLLPDRWAPHVVKTIETRKPTDAAGCECIPLSARASTRPRRLLRALTHTLKFLHDEDVSMALSVRQVDTSVPLAHSGLSGRMGWRQFCKTLRRLIFSRRTVRCHARQEKKNGTAVAIRR